MTRERLAWIAGAVLLLISLTWAQHAYGAADMPVLLSDEAWATIKTLGLVVVLAVYRVFKKFKREAHKNKWDWIDRNIVELAVIGLLFPSTVVLAQKILLVPVAQ